MYNKQLLLKAMLLIAVMVSGVTNAWSEETYEIIFLTGTSDNTTAMKSTDSVTGVIGDGANYVSSFGTGTAKAYPKSKKGIKLGTSSENGAIELNLASDYQANIKTITILSSQYGTDTGTLTLSSGSTNLKTGITPGEDYTHTFSTPTTVSSLKISTSSKRAYISKIILTTLIVLDYTLTATSSNETYGTVSVSENKIIATPKNGYRVSTSAPYQIVSGTATISQDGNVFTVTANADCTIQVNFEAIPQHNAIFNANGTTTTIPYYEGSKISLPTNLESILGNDFIGWTTNSIQGTTTIAPEILTEATMSNDDIEFYAVYATPFSEIVTITKSFGFETTSNSDWTFEGPERNNGMANTGSYSGRINVNKSYVTFKNKVKATEFSFAFARTSTNANYYVHIETSTDNSTWNTVENYPMNTFNNGSFTTKSHTFDGKSEVYVRFYCYNTTAVRYVDDVTIKYLEEQQRYTDYCTTVASTATVSIASACTDGDLFYGTYSNTTAFVVPSDLEVYEISILDGEIYKEKYNTGDVVPAKTGVFVAALEAGDYTLNLSNEEGSSVLGEDNMLRPTDKGISALTMAANDSDCMYYRLTMHNGTQIGFYWGAEDGAAFDVAANKAYLAVPIETAGNVRGFNLFGDATAIKDLKSTTAERTTYNIQGQRVSANTKGIVISNGKKYFNK